MIEFITVTNPFTLEKNSSIREYTGEKLLSYIAIDTELMDVYKNGHIVADPGKCYPADGEQYIITPHIGGKGFNSVLGWVVSISLMVAAPYVGGWMGITSKFGQALASGAFMILGGKLINSVFHLNQQNSDTETSLSNTYGWDLPGVQTQEGNVIGETYGECIPAPQLLMYHIETVNSDDEDANIQYLNLLYCGGYGPVDEIKDVRIGYTPIENFSNVQIEKRLGTNDQEPISFFPNTVSDQSIDLEVKEGNEIIRSTDSDQTNRIDVTVTFPNGIYYTDDDGDFCNQTAKFSISYRKTGTSSWTTQEYSLTKKTNKAIRRTYSFENLEAARYDVRVAAIETPITNRRYALMQWSVLSAYVYTGAFSRPGKVLIALRIKATNQLNGGIPNLTWRQRRGSVYVYDPTNGYISKPANNPIWAAYDILHRCRLLKNINTGQMEYVAEGSQKENFVQYFDQWQDAADYADEMISNQEGTKEKRFQFDAYFDTVQKRLEAANKAAAVGHATIIQHGTAFGIATDRPGVMRQFFGEGRTIMSSLSGDFSSLDDRARSVEITYNDSQNDFKNTEFFIRSAKYNEDVELQDNTAQLTLFGVSRRSQAYREGMYLLATNERELETITFSADINAIVVEYGDIIGVNHAVANVGVASGRIISIDGNIIKLDKEITLEAGDTYGIKIQLSKNDEIVTREIKAVDTETVTDMIPVTESFSIDDMPEQYDNYAIGEIEKIVEPYRVIKVEKDGDEKVSMTCIQYDEAVYDVDYERYPVIDYTSPSPLKAPLNMTLAEQTTKNYMGVKMCNINASWEMPSNSRYDAFHVWYSTDGIAWTMLPSVTDMQTTIVNVDPALAYRVRVCAVLDGIESAYVIQAINLTGDIKAAITPTDIVAYTRYRQLRDGTPRYDIQTMWGPDKLQARVYYKINHVQANELVFAEGVAADELGWLGGWILAGIGINQITIPQAIPGDTYRIAITTANEVGEYTLPDNSQYVDMLVAIKTTIPNTPDNFVIWFDSVTHASWGAVTNTDVAFYEVRTDQNAGMKSTAFLMRTNSLTATLNLKVRNGFLYLYACGSDGKYSAAAELQYKKDLPKMPDAPAVTDKLGGMSIVAGAIPPDCIGMNVYINDVMLFTPNSMMTYTCGAGIYDVSIAYVDLFGPGKKSDETRCVVKVKVDQALLDEEAVSLKNIDDALKKAVENANQSVEKIDTINTDITGINGNINTITDNLNNTDTATNQYGAIVSLHKALQDNSDRITSTITAYTDADSKLESKIEQTATSLSSTVQANKDAQDKTNTAVASDISQIKQTATSLSSTVQANKDAQDKTNTAVASDISQIKQTATSLSSTVQANKDAQDETNTALSSEITQNANSITSIVTNLGKTPETSGYTAITQLNDAVNLRVAKGDVINQINLTKDGTIIDGKFLHITGTTLFDDSVIVSKMMQAGAVTADKIAVTDLSAISANIGSLKGGTITGTQIVGTNFRNSSGSFTVDDSGNIVGAHLTSGSIDTGSMTLSGYQVKATAFVRGTINDGETIPLPNGYSENECFWGTMAGSGSVSSGYIGRTAIFYHTELVTNRSSIWVGTEYIPIVYNYETQVRGGSGSYWCMGVKT